MSGSDTFSGDASACPLAADVPAVKAIGKNTWQAHDLWPVSDAEFWEIAEVAHAAFDVELRQLEISSPECSDVFLADTAFLGQIVQALHNDLAEARALRAGRRLVAAAPAPFSSARDPQRSARMLAGAASGPQLPRRIAVRLAKRLLFNRQLRTLQLFKSSWGIADAWVVGSFGALLEGYAKHHKLSMDAPGVADLVPAGALTGVVPAAPPAAAGAARTVLSHCLDHMSRAHSLELDPESLFQTWLARLALLVSAHRRLSRVRPPSVVMLGETSKTWPKLIGLALKRRGARVVGTNHGYFIGQMSLPGIAWHTHAPCDEIVCYSDADAELLALDYSHTSIGARRPVRFAPVPGQQLICDLKSKLAAGPPANHPAKCAMLIGYPMNNQRYAWSAGDYFAFQLDAELRLARLMREAGLRVIYKVHPDRKQEARGLFEDEVDEVITTRFEDVWHLADAFIFGNIMTTVFNIAALTDRPLIALEVENYRWMPNVRQTCARRVRFIETRFGPGNRLEFDGAEVVRAVREAHATVDATYAQTYLLRTNPPSDAPHPR